MTTPKLPILDVRPILARGEEPFSQILARVDALAPKEGITVVAPFMPAPLIELLKGEGFQVTVEHSGAGTWSVQIRRP
jgi:uncharacterized protein (DUF2249 family)